MVAKKRALILTAKDTETEAVKSQMHSILRKEYSQHGSPFLVRAMRDEKNMLTAAPDVEVGLFETGRGQAEAQQWTSSIVASFDPDLVLFVGCAGGEPDLTEIGDVMIATEIWPYEKASVSARTQRSKAHPSKPDRALVEEAKVAAELCNWLKRVPQQVSAPTVRFGPIASGEKVVKHTQSATWRHIKDMVSDEIIACETEGHGFLAALSVFKTFGLMVRGISDNLVGKDAAGKQIDDANQIRATMNAAAFACSIIEHANFDLIRKIRGSSPRPTVLVRDSQKATPSIHVGGNLSMRQSTIVQGNVVDSKVLLADAYPTDEISVRTSNIERAKISLSELARIAESVELCKLCQNLKLKLNENSERGTLNPFSSKLLKLRESEPEAVREVIERLVRDLEVISST